MHTSDPSAHQTMHPAKTCAPSFHMFKKGTHVQVYGSKNPYTRQQNHAPGLKGAHLIFDKVNVCITKIFLRHRLLFLIG